MSPLGAAGDSLALLGDDAVAAPQTGLSASERKALLEEELVAIRLAERRGELVRLAEVEMSVAEFVALVADRLESLPQRLMRRTQMSREQLATMEEVVRADREAIADAMQGMVTAADADRTDAAAGSEHPAI